MSHVKPRGGLNVTRSQGEIFYQWHMFIVSTIIKTLADNGSISLFYEVDKFKQNSKYY